MYCSRLILLFSLAIHLVSSSFSCDTAVSPPKNCSKINLKHVKGTAFLQWPEWCEVFHGELKLRNIDLQRADFRKLRKINGSVQLINTGYSRMPQMPCLSEIETNGSYPGVVILNNKRLRDIRGFINWDRHFRIQGYTQFPVFISGNEQLDTVNMPSIIHHQFSPISCEKRLTPNYSIQYAEAMSLSFVLISLIISATVFLYPLSLGSANIYFVPGYHKS
ncbi:hypothetical protein CRE_02742 [Caenorhabditis remanei]|uniref:Receptor L-domain domain-containing protein n=1 Tax=Caenorhabditis remanei TaxID=31234 RepID=E3NQX2_CAERE|nr:hypothetical protein CRE_02742 [Caenorhabditis remanei]